mgnify:FL=1|uniref:Uncharacterized protein n=2 Tax=root TaxID=1 RepID=A0A8S5V8U2_9CAUD|nr:MAG TPA: hypothetical protein [Siphoviridae sp. ctS2049]
MMTEEEKAKRRFFMSEDARTVFIPPCAVCKNVDGLNCKALKGRRPEKYYMDDNPDFQKCPKFDFNPNAFYADKYKELSKHYNW